MATDDRQGDPPRPRGTLAGGADVGPVARRCAAGAVVGAAVGLILGLVIHAVVADDSSLVWFEMVGGLVGLAAGAAIGAFYGGALSVPRRRPSRDSDSV